MPSPFPGMDPWLEHPAEWPGTHHLLISASAGLLNQQLKPRGYYVKVDERVWLEESDSASRPDLAVVERPLGNTSAPRSDAADEPVRIAMLSVDVREGFLEVYDARGHQVVTGIEFVSPSNKRPGPGRDQYRGKRREWTKAGVNVVEIDLLRAGKHLLDIPRDKLAGLGDWTYLANIVRHPRERYEVYPIALRARLPRLRIPLKPADEDGVLDLQAALDDAYDHGPYPESIDYTAAPTPPWSPADATWADELLKQAGFRPGA